MAQDNDFDSEIRRIGDALKAMREALLPGLALLADTHVSLMLPEDERCAAEQARIEAELPQWQALETALVTLVTDLADETAIRAQEFDTRDLPTRNERLLGYLSKSMMRRRMEARWRSPDLANHFAELLRRADLLMDVLKNEREFLVSHRTQSESDLVALIDRRPGILERLRGEDGGAMTGVEATHRTEMVVGLFQNFVTTLNARVATCNVLIHRLMADRKVTQALYLAAREIVPVAAGEPAGPVR